MVYTNSHFNCKTNSSNSSSRAASLEANKCWRELKCAPLLSAKIQCAESQALGDRTAHLYWNVASSDCPFLQRHVDGRLRSWLNSMKPWFHPVLCQRWCLCWNVVGMFSWRTNGPSLPNVHGFNVKCLYYWQCFFSLWHMHVCIKLCQWLMYGFVNRSIVGFKDSFWNAETI